MTAACRGLGGAAWGSGDPLASGALFGTAAVDEPPTTGRLPGTGFSGAASTFGGSGRIGRSTCAGAGASAGGDATGAGLDAAGAGEALTGDGADAIGDGLDAAGAGVEATGAGTAAAGAGDSATSVGHDHHTSTTVRRMALAVRTAISQAGARPHTDRALGARVSSRCTAGT
jgi:hypothetical protein